MPIFDGVCEICALMTVNYYGWWGGVCEWGSVIENGLVLIMFIHIRD